MAVDRTTLIFVVATAALIGACGGNVEEPPDPYAEVLRPFVEGGRFSGVVLIEEAGSVLFRAHHGAASVELNVPVAPGTRFKLHSLTKPLMASAILNAVARGKLSLDDPICDVLDPCPGVWQAVTVRHLLGHRSGIPDFSGELLESWRGSLEGTLNVIHETLSSMPPQWEPGTDWQYSNAGYVLLARILELVEGLPIDEAMERTLFGPAGMTDAGMELSPPWEEAQYDGALVVPRLAMGYNGAPGRLQVAHSKMYVIPGAGAAYGTAEDLAAFTRALFEGDLLPGDLRDAAVHVDDDASVPYALGWVVRERHGERVYRHDGGNNGFISSLEYYPDRRLTIIILSNLGFTPVEEIRDELAAISLAGGPRSREPS